MQLPVTLECLKQVSYDGFLNNLYLLFHQGNMGKLVKQLTKQENQGEHYIE